MALLLAILLLLALLQAIFLVPPSGHSDPRSISVRSSTIYVPENYSRIQDAVDAAPSGDTVIVAAGTYFENLTILKPLTLQGAGADSTRIDAGGRGPALTIAGTFNVTVAGFTLLNPQFDNCTLLVKDSMNITISQNSIFDGECGISIMDSIQVLVHGSIVQRNFYGISIERGSKNQVLNSTVSLNSVNVNISGSRNNTIVSNILSDAEGGIDLIMGSAGNNITGNRIEKNRDTGLYLEGSENNTISGNLIAFTNDIANSAAVGITLATASGNLFYRNNLLSNDKQVFANDPEDMASNTWDDGSVGNFWDDYRGIDDGSADPRTGLPRIAGDGVGDTLVPHPCPQGGVPCSLAGAPVGVDWLPLMSPWWPPVLVAVAKANITEGYPPLQVEFAGLAAGGKSPYSYSWNLGDGTNAQSQNVTHTYDAPGLYLSILTVTDYDGSVATSKLTVTVREPLGVLVIIVLDESGKPVSGASVTAVSVPASQEVFSGNTNNLGRIVFNQTLAGPYVLRAGAAGFLTQDAGANVAAGETSTLNIILIRTPQGLPFAYYIVTGSAAGGGIVSFWIWRRWRKGTALSA